LLPSTRMRGIRRIAPHDGHRDFAILHETPPMHPLHKPAAWALPGVRPVAVRPRTRRVPVKAKSTAHLLLGVIHWR